MAAEEGIFCSKCSTDEQMKWFTSLRSSDPEKARMMYLKGDELVKLATAGNLRKFMMALDGVEKDFILQYFVRQMMIGSLLEDNQVRVGAAPQANNGLLAHCLAVTPDDFRGASIVEFMVKNGVDVNAQLEETWETVIFIAIRRQMVLTLEMLLAHKADVNVVAKNDMMPLKVAEASLCQEPSYEQIVEMLVQRGATRSWRTQAAATVAVPAACSGAAGKNFWATAIPTKAPMVTVFMNTSGVRREESNYSSVALPVALQGLCLDADGKADGKTGASSASSTTPIAGMVAASEDGQAQLFSTCS